jgi:pimeloyl-ACP methyl ester carboxylesterase
MITPFEIKVPEQALEDLKSRILQTRWPDVISGSGWEFGADIAYMKELANYWVSSFNWRKTEAQLNSIPNFMAVINGYTIHFLHIKGVSPNSLPLIISHGWPYSVLEMMKIIPMLTSGKDYSFDLVIPSLMGYGYSQKIQERGCNAFFMAELWHKLMMELGYSKYGLQGGDFGAGISAALAYKFPESVAGMHMNYIPGIYEPVADDEDYTPDEKAYLQSEDTWYLNEGGYSHQQGTKPLTLAYPLNDSPIGLCAWIVEKMRGWADCRGDVESVFAKDELLSNVTLYWLTETIHSSIRLYNENRKIKLKTGINNKINIPVGIARFRYEEPFPPRKYVERGFNVVRWKEFPVGGHFPAIEQPELLSNDIIEFFKTI